MRKIDGQARKIRDVLSCKRYSIDCDPRGADLEAGEIAGDVPGVPAVLQLS